MGMGESERECVCVCLCVSSRLFVSDLSYAIRVLNVRRGVVTTLAGVCVCIVCMCMYVCVCIVCVCERERESACVHEQLIMELCL